MLAKNEERYLLMLHTTHNVRFLKRLNFMIDSWLSESKNFSRVDHKALPWFEMQGFQWREIRVHASSYARHARSKILGVR